MILFGGAWTRVAAAFRWVRRPLSKDKTLVFYYTFGILEAFLGAQSRPKRGLGPAKTGSKPLFVEITKTPCSTVLLASWGWLWGAQGWPQRGPRAAKSGPGAAKAAKTTQECPRELTNLG